MEECIISQCKNAPGGGGVFSAQRRGKLGYWSGQVVVGSMFAHVIGLLAVDLRSCLANHLEKDGLAAQTGRAVAKINARSWPLVTCSAMDGRAWGRLDESGQGTPTCLSLRRKAPSRISCGISCQDLSLTPNSSPSSQLPNFPTSCHLLNFVPQQPTYSRPPTTSSAKCLSLHLRAKAWRIPPHSAAHLLPRVLTSHYLLSPVQHGRLRQANLNRTMAVSPAPKIPFLGHLRTLHRSALPRTATTDIYRNEVTSLCWWWVHLVLGSLLSLLLSPKPPRQSQRP